MRLNRYEPFTEDGVAIMDLHPYGDYVKYDEYIKAIQTLKKIANEDYRGNRPQSAVDAYNTLKELGEIDEK